MGLFLVTVLSIWAAIHLYVFWRLTSIPWLAARVSPLAFVIVGVALWSSYVVVRILDGRGLQASIWPLEYVAANWIGLAFLLLCAFLVADLVTLGGWLFPRRSPAIRGWAAVTAGVLALVGLVQAMRPPVVRDYAVRLPGLPPERDGTVVVAVSDLHLGNLLGRQWLKHLVARVNAMRPDLLLVIGDLVDGNVGRVEPLREVLKELKAPLGVWAVTGNHEYYAGIDRSVRLFEQAGFHVLRDHHAQVAPGLILAGVDDLTARAQLGAADNAVARAVANRAEGATILLSHTPWETGTAAQAGVGLMLSGHTHNGQIWPFKYLVASRYPFLAGRYEIQGMSAIVCRGTGTWGPRMRLWRPSELLRIRLLAATPVARRPVNDS